MGKDINGKELGKGITQRNDGRYNARVTINGVKINLYDYNLSLLKKNLEAKKLKVLRDDYSTRPNISLNQWYKDEWFPVYKSPYLKDEVNRHNYIVRYENTFGRLLGNRRISCITEILIQKAANSLIDDFGYSTKFIRESVSSLKEAFNAAVTNHLISRNPSSNIVVKNDNLVSERVVMTDEQQMQFLNIAKHRYYNEVYQILLSTGMRIGDDDDKIRLNQRKPSKYKGLSRFGPEKNLQRINKFMKERPIFYKNLIQMKENFRFYLRCFYCITKVVILQFNSENRTELARNG